MLTRQFHKEVDAFLASLKMQPILATKCGPKIIHIHVGGQAGVFKRRILKAGWFEVNTNAWFGEKEVYLAHPDLGKSGISVVTFPKNLKERNYVVLRRNVILGAVS